MKKYIIILLILCFILTGCSGYTHYPVIIGDSIIKNVPRSVISFDNYTNSNITALGFSDRLVGDIDNFGTALTPNTDYLISLDADILVSSCEILSSTRQKLEKSGTIVVIVPPVTSLSDLEENYVTYYRIMLGNDYAEDARKKIKDYISDEFNYIKSGSTNSSVLFIMHKPMFGATQNSYMEEILKKCGVNIVSDGQKWNLDSNSNPDIIICDNNYTFSEIKKCDLRDSNAVKNNNFVNIDILPFESQSIDLFEELRKACLSAYKFSSFPQTVPSLSLSYTEPPEPTIFESIGQFFNNLK